jgi:hypothetical protein
VPEYEAAEPTVDAARHTLEAHVGGTASLEAVGHQELGGTLALDIAAKVFIRRVRVKRIPSCIS